MLLSKQSVFTSYFGITKVPDIIYNFCLMENQEKQVAWANTKWEKRTGMPAIWRHKLQYIFFYNPVK